MHICLVLQYIFWQERAKLSSERSTRLTDSPKGQAPELDALRAEVASISQIKIRHAQQQETLQRTVAELETEMHVLKQEVGTKLEE